MASFFVGQRVRVNCPESKVHGQETRIVALSVQGETLGVRYVGHRVDLLRPWMGTNLVFEPHELEPILPDGHRACDDDFKADLDRLLERQGIAA